MFRKMKAAAKRVASTSMGVLALYDTINSRLNATKELSAEQYPNWVKTWDDNYRRN